MLIILNGVKIDANIEKVNEEQKEFKVEFEIVGENNYNLYKALLANKKIEVSLPEFELEYKGKISSLSNSYSGKLNENTIVSYSFNISEIGENEEKWTLYDGLVYTAINNWTRTRALAKILEDKNLLTRDEYEKLIEEIGESDFEEMKKFIFKGE